MPYDTMTDCTRADAYDPSSDCVAENGDGCWCPDCRHECSYQIRTAARKCECLGSGPVLVSGTDLARLAGWVRTFAWERMEFSAEADEGMLWSMADVLGRVAQAKP